MLKLKYLLCIALFCSGLLSPFSKAENSFLDSQYTQAKLKANSKTIVSDNPLNELEENSKIESQKTVSSKNKTLQSKKQISKPKNDKDKSLAPVELEKTPSGNEEVKPEENKELNKITEERKENTEKTIDAINFIQPSLSISKEEQNKIDLALTRAEQEQLTILWRATLERNKTIHFIVQKLAPEGQTKKKNQVLSQVLNTAIFLPFYALQAVSPADTSQLASYLGAGLASDLINGKARRNSDKMQLSQTEMVIMFMMIDQVAERLRQQYHAYKQERIDAVLAQNELEEAQKEAAASLELSSPESRFLSQVRIRQIERELRRTNLRVRSNRIVLVDLSGSEAVDQVDKLIDKEMAAITTL